jgi:hypothetical protein
MDYLSALDILDPGISHNRGSTLITGLGGFLKIIVFLYATLLVHDVLNLTFVYKLALIFSLLASY